MIREIHDFQTGRLYWSIDWYTPRNPNDPIPKRISCTNPESCSICLGYKGNPNVRIRKLIIPKRTSPNG